MFADPHHGGPLGSDAPEHFEDVTASPGTEHWIFAGFAAVFNYSAANLVTEHGIGICKAWHRRGVGSQVVALMYDYGFRLRSEGGLGLRRMYGTTPIWNKGSMAFHQACGLKIEGTLRSVKLKGSWQNGENRE